MTTASLHTAGVDPRELRDTCGNWVTGISVITSTDRDSMPVGMAVNSFTSLSLDPPLILFCPAKSSSTWPKIQENGRFIVNILAEGQEHMSRAFAVRGGDKFSAIDYELEDGLPLLPGSAASLTCTLTQVLEGGDHDIAVARVDATAQYPVSPLIFHRGRVGTF